MSKRRKIIIAVLALTFLVTLACGSSNSGTKVTPSAVEAQDEATTAPETDVDVPEDSESSQADGAAAEPLMDVFGVGDLVEVGDQTIRLNSIEYQGDVLVANFTIENHGDSDLNVSSLLSFSAKNADGTKLEVEIFDCGDAQLGGKVLPGDKLRGSICWSGADPDSGIQVYYQASLLGSGAVVWTAVEGTAEPLESGADESSEIEVFQVGDLIEVQDHTIRLNSITYHGDILVANFSIENMGDSDVDVSSMMSFTAKNEDGTKLDQEIFDCDQPNLDGSVLPGDRLRGGICWSGATPADGIKIYYEASMFGEGALVWEALEASDEPIVEFDAPIKVETFSVGDVIDLQDRTIVLNEVGFQGDVLKANFTIENTSTSDVSVSSMLSFGARSRDGSNLDQQIFDCGTSLDGDIIANDKLRGDICWSGASAGDGIKIYYEADLFGEGAVVWVVQ